MWTSLPRILTLYTCTIAWRQPSHLSPRHKRRAQNEEIGWIKRWARVINQQACGWHVKAWHVSWWILYRFNKDSTHAQRWPSKVIVEERLFWKSQIWKKKKKQLQDRNESNPCVTSHSSLSSYQHISRLLVASSHLYLLFQRGHFPFFEEVAPHCAIILLYSHLTSVISCFLSSW